MKLLFAFLFVLVLSQSAKSPSFNIRFQGSVSSPIISFVGQCFFMATFCHHKYFNRRIVYSCGHPGTFCPAVKTNEALMVYGNMKKDGKASHTASAGKTRSSPEISDYFFKRGKPFYQVSKLRIISATVKCRHARNLF